MPRTLRVTALALMAAANSFAQSAGAAPKFKVASIKPNTSTGQSSSINIDHVEIFVRNSTLHSIVQYAFSTRSFGVAASTGFPRRVLTLQPDSPPGRPAPNVKR